MRRRSKVDFAVLTAVLITFGAGCATAGTVKVPSGFMTGDQYRKLPEEVQQFYAMGLVDGMFVAATFGAPERGAIVRLNDCMAKMKSDQLAAILSKELSDHPEVWHKPMNVTGVNALIGACELKK